MLLSEESALIGRAMSHGRTIAIQAKIEHSIKNVRRYFSIIQQFWVRVLSISHPGALQHVGRE